MKKMIAAILALTMMLTLVACGNKSDNKVDSSSPDNVNIPDEETNINQDTNTVPDVVETVDLTKYYEDFMTLLGGNAPFMMPADPDTLEAFYPGLKDIATKQCVVNMAAMSAVAFEFALIECENAADVEAVKAILEARKAYQVDGGAWYPETCENWEKAQIIVKGNIVALILAGDVTEEAVKFFNGEEVEFPVYVDLYAFYEEFMLSLGEENAPFMMPADYDTLEAFYPGLNEIATKQSVIQMAAMTAVAFEFALIECENAADVETVKAIFEARRAYQVDGGAWYPETCSTWAKAEIIVRDNYVVLILAGGQTADAVASFNAFFE